MLQGVATIAQMTILEPVVNATDTTEAAEAAGSGTAASLDSLQSGAAGQSICVVNSHFFFHPNASHVRNIHTAAIMSEVQAFMLEQSSRSATNNSATPGPAEHADTAMEGAAEGSETSTSLSRASDSMQHAQSEKPALVFSGDLNSDFNDGTPGTQPEAKLQPHHPQSNTQSALLFCGDLNCGLNQGTPGSHALWLMFL